MANSDRIKELYSAAGQAHHEAISLLDQHEGRELPGEIEQKVSSLLDECKRKQEEARLLERVDGLERELKSADDGRRLATPLRLQRTGERGQELSAEAKAFDLYLRTGERAPSEVKAALNVTTDSQGGYLTPTEYSDSLSRELYDLSILRQAGARIVPLHSDSSRMATLTATAAAVLTGEGSAYDEKEPTFGEVNFTPFKYTRLAKASDELVADSRFPLWDVILKPDFAQAFAQTENTAFTTGTGSGQPEGVLNSATVGVTLANGTSQVSSIASPDSLLDLYYALDYKYRPRAKWMMSDTTMKIVRKFKDSTNQYVWQPGLTSGQADTLFNRPVLVNPAMPAPAANAKTILFGDFSYFWIGEREGLQIKVLTELYAGTGQVGFRAYKRFDSHVMLASALQVLKQAAS